MASKQAWQDRAKILNVLNSLEIYLRSYATTFESLKSFKEEILDIPERFADLKRIIDEDPTWTMQTLAEKYQFYKKIYDWLEVNKYIN